MYIVLLAVFLPDGVIEHNQYKLNIILFPLLFIHHRLKNKENDRTCKLNISNEKLYLTLTFINPLDLPRRNILLTNNNIIQMY